MYRCGGLNSVSKHTKKCMRLRNLPTGMSKILYVWYFFVFCAYCLVLQCRFLTNMCEMNLLRHHLQRSTLKYSITVHFIFKSVMYLPPLQSVQYYQCIRKSFLKRSRSRSNPPLISGSRSQSNPGHVRSI